jgi:glutamate synthase (NADPH/NADH) large chain
VPYPHSFPPAQGLYDPRQEHDACGVAFVATLTGEASHDIVRKAITALLNLDHRGAAGAEPNSGDGAGILLQVPDAFLRAVTAEAGFELPPPRSYAVGAAFLPGDDEQVAKTRRRIEQIAAEEGLAVPRWREVPGAADVLGRKAAARDAGVSSSCSWPVTAAGDRDGLWSGWRSACASGREETDVYFPSLSSRTSPTRACSPPTSSTSSSPTCVDERSPRAGRRALALLDQHRSRAGRCRTRSGSSPTTARSTR